MPTVRTLPFPRRPILMGLAAVPFAAASGVALSLSEGTESKAPRNTADQLLSVAEFEKHISGISRQA